MTVDGAWGALRLHLTSNAMGTGLVQDIRYALRGWRRSPGFAAVALVSLALGIGANVAIFSRIHTLLLRTLPVRAPEQLVELRNPYPGDPPVNAFSRQSYEHFRDENHVFSGLCSRSIG